MSASIEEVRAFWDARPCNVRHSSEPIGTLQYSREVTRRRYRVEPHIRDFAGFNDPEKVWPSMRVLEIGCGIGTDTIEFAKCGAFVTAADLSNESLEIADDRTKTHDLSGLVRFVQANAEELNLGTNNFDLVYSFGVIHHTPDPLRALQSVRDHCNPLTDVRIMVYHAFSMKVMKTLLMNRFRWGSIAKYSEAQTGSPVTHVYTRRQAKELMESAGFHVKDISVRFLFPYVIDDYKKGVLRKTWFFQYMPKFMYRSLERLVGWHLLIEAKIA